MHNKLRIETQLILMFYNNLMITTMHVSYNITEDPGSPTRVIVPRQLSANCQHHQPQGFRLTRHNLDFTLSPTTNYKLFTLHLRYHGCSSRSRY